MATGVGDLVEPFKPADLAVVVTGGVDRLAGIERRPTPDPDDHVGFVLGERGDPTRDIVLRRPTGDHNLCGDDRLRREGLDDPLRDSPRRERRYRSPPEPGAPPARSG